MDFWACPQLQSWRYCPAQGERELDEVPGGPGGHTLPGGSLTLLWGEQKVTLHSPGLGCRPPGHSFLGYRQRNFFSFTVKFHLVGFRPLFPERSGIPLTPSAGQGLSQPPGHSSLARLTSSGHCSTSFVHSASLHGTPPGHGGPEAEVWFTI